MRNIYVMDHVISYLRENTVWNKIEAPKDSIWNKYKKNEHFKLTNR